MEQEISSHNTNVKKGISGSTLKLIAIITMLIDHVGAAVIWRMILSNAAAGSMEGTIAYDGLLRIYMIMRYIGRIAFPIFCFLMVEGLQKTRNKAKYAFRLGIFALASEIPFDLAFSSKILEFDYQNVFFTLFIGLLTMIAADKINQMPDKCVNDNARKIMKIFKYPIQLMIMAIGALVAEFLQTDYGAIGVICIMVLYFFRKIKVLQIVAGCFAFLWELTAPFAFIPIGFYNGRRGLKLKYVFYLFYPMHLLILYFICVVMGISGYSAV